MVSMTISKIVSCREAHPKADDILYPCIVELTRCQQRLKIKLGISWFVGKVNVRREKDAAESHWTAGRAAAY